MSKLRIQGIQAMVMASVRPRSLIILTEALLELLPCDP
jgi:hypothetical protein